MKKLFLYLGLLLVAIYIFLTFFFIFRDTFKEKSKDIVANTIEELSTEDTVDAIDYINNNEKNTSEDTDLKTNVNVIECYKVGIKNGFVIVYDGSSDSVYEYTGIDANIIKATDEDLYREIVNEIEFDTKEDMFDFLESIAS